MVEQRINSKCKLKCYVKPMKDPLDVSPSIGSQGTDSLCPLSRHSNGRSNPKVVGSIPTEDKIIFSLPRVVP